MESYKRCVKRKLGQRHLQYIVMLHSESMQEASQNHQPEVRRTSPQALHAGLLLGPSPQDVTIVVLRHLLSLVFISKEGQEEPHQRPFSLAALSSKYFCGKVFHLERSREGQLPSMFCCPFPSAFHKVHPGEAPNDFRDGAGAFRVNCSFCFLQ